MRNLELAALLHDVGKFFEGKHHEDEVPEEEVPTMGPNVLALEPRKCLAIEGNPVTRRRLEAAGCEVLTYRGDELSLKAEGGATCLTRPILRTDD